MRWLKTAVQISCPLPLITGAMDLVLGARVLSATGAALPAEALSDPVLNSQIRFWGAIWFGFGVVLWVVARDLHANALWFRLLCGVLFLSGIGRAVSMLQFGLPSPPLIGATALELVGIPLLLWWRSNALRKS
jgi:hypothetical protein